MQLGPVKHTARGFQIIEFIDHYGKECSLQQSSLALYEPPGSSAIWLGVNGTDRMHLTVAQVSALVDTLTNWLQTGYFDQGDNQ